MYAYAYAHPIMRRCGYAVDDITAIPSLGRPQTHCRVSKVATRARFCPCTIVLSASPALFTFLATVRRRMQ